MKRAVNPIIKQRLKSLYPGKDAEALFDDYLKRKKKRCALAISVGFMLGLVFFISDRVNGSISGDGEIDRQDYVGQAFEVPVEVKSQEHGSNELKITVSNHTYTEQEIAALFEETKEWLQSVMVKDNESLSCVRENLYFPGENEDGTVLISYESSHYDVIDGSGRIDNSELKQEETVFITAQLSYEDRCESYTYEVTIFPPIKTESERFWENMRKALVDEDKRQKEKPVFMLPTQIDGEAVSYREKTDGRPFIMAAMGLLCALMIYKGMDRDLDKLYEKRKQSLLTDYSDFTSKLALLTGAGMSVSKAISKIYQDEKRFGMDEKGNEAEAPLYEELGIYVRSIENGILEEQAIQDFGRRCGLPVYRKFCTLLAVNLKKGSMNLAALLERESEEAFSEQQSRIRKLGEEAGTKLLLPMILMLVVVMIIVMVPAFMTYQLS